MVRTKFVKAGDWRTLEWFWNSKATAFFKAPAGATIKVRYGGGWIFGSDSQKQKLDGETYKKLTVGGWSFFYARIQIYVSRDTNVTYDIYPGSVAVMTPTIPF